MYIVEVFRLRLGKALNYEFNEDSQTGLNATYVSAHPTNIVNRSLPAAGSSRGWSSTGY